MTPEACDVAVEDARRRSASETTPSWMRAPAPSLSPIIGHADGGGQVHDLVDLLGEDLAERAAEDGEVLAEHADPPAVDGPEAGDHAVGVGPVLLEAHAVGPVAGQHVELLERALVEQVVDALPGGHLALGVVLLDRVRRAGVEGLLAAFGQLREALGHRMVHRPEATGPASRSRLRSPTRVGPGGVLSLPC